MLANPSASASDELAPHARIRENLIYLLLFALLLLGGLGGWLAFRYTLPLDSPWLEIGVRERYPPRAEPYLITQDRTAFYLYNDGTQLFAVDLRTHVPPMRMACFVIWDDAQVLIDPCYGTRFSAYGDYLFYGPPPLRGLDRYPVRVTENDVIQVSEQPTLQARSPEQVAKLCHLTVHSALSAGLPTTLWNSIPYNCDFRAVAYADVATID
ncbi:MAG: hypothetical protein WDZ49_15550 [Litorilinea sp.]